MRFLPDFYREPLGLPLRGSDEQTVLPAAIRAYLDAALNGTEMDVAQFLLVRDWLRYYINAPCWFIGDIEPDDYQEELSKLRKSVTELKAVEDIKAWIVECLDLGIDPL